MKGPQALLAALCFGGGLVFKSIGAGPVNYWLAVGFVSAGSAYSHRAAVAWIEDGKDILLELWGLTWTRDELCCHFLITGPTGCGKTARAIVPILHGLRRKLPSTAILAIDSKGVLWKPLSAIAKALGQEDSLRLIRVRPTHVPREQWQAPLRLNVPADPSVPWSTYAKIVVDTATAAGQRGGQSFFKETAKDAITHAMQALDVAGLPVTLSNVHNVVCISADTQTLLEYLSAAKGPAAEAERQFFKDFSAQPPEQKSGTVFTVANFLRPYTPADIKEVFCSVEPNFSLVEVDLGRLICLSIPQTYQVERKYLNLLCKQLFFLHAFRRFDLDPAEMRRRNVITLVLDEGQKTTLVSEDGFSDHLTVDELREAGVCLIAATQTPLSFYASFETERKADVFMANLRTQIHFGAADEKGAKIVSEKMGGREIKKTSGGRSGGGESTSWQLTNEPWFKPSDLLAMRDGRAVVKHPRRSTKPYLRQLRYSDFTRG